MTTQSLQILVSGMREMASAMTRDHMREAAALGQELLQKANEQAFDLSQELGELAQVAQDKELKAFLDKISSILQRMHQIAQETAPAEAKNLSTPRQILQQLNQAFEKHIDPMMQNTQNYVAKDPKRAENLGQILGMAKQTFEVCQKMVSFSDKMNTEEKMYAVAGTVLMVAGIACLIAAAANPVTGPALAAITIAGFALHALGLSFGKKAIARHVEVEPEAKKIDAALDGLNEEAKQLEKRFNAKMPAESIVFNAAEEDVAACHRTIEVRSVEEPKPDSTAAKVTAAFRSFLGLK